MGTGLTKYENAHEAIQDYLKKLVKRNVSLGDAERILQDLRTYICAILEQKLNNCTIAIYADSHMDCLKCQIGNGRHGVVIHISGDQIKWIFPGESTHVTTEKYAKELGQFVKMG